MNIQGQRSAIHSNASSAIQTLLRGYVNDAPVSVYELVFAAEELCPQFDFVDLLDIAAQEISACGRCAQWEKEASSQ